MSENLPNGWVNASLSSLVARDGVMVDGDWVESKDQDPSGEVRLIQLADVGSGRFINKSNRWLTSEKASKLNCTMLSTGDLLISRLGEPLGKACIFPLIESECVTVVDVHIFRSGTPLVDHRWLMHALNSHSVRAEVESQSSGTTRKRITGQKLKNLQLPIPPSAEQQRIASRVDELFSSIDEGERALERVRKLVERYRQSVLKAAVTGELTREWRKQHAGELESGEALLTRILEARRKAWETAELTKMMGIRQRTLDQKWKRQYVDPSSPNPSGGNSLPHGWLATSLDQILAVEKGAMKTGPFGSLLNKSEHVSNGVPILGIENIGTLRFIRGSNIHVTEEKAKELAGYRAGPGDIVISRSGTVGEVCVVPEDIGEARISTNLIKVSLFPNGLLPELFALQLYSSPSILRQLRELCKGSTRLFLNQEILRQLTFALPPTAEQKVVLDLLTNEMSVIDALEKELIRLRSRSISLRQALLSAAFSGKLVQQDVTDEPASVLLERIASERASRARRPAFNRLRKKQGKS